MLGRIPTVAGSVQLAENHLTARGVATHGEDPEPVRREANRDRSADPGGRSRDDGDAAHVSTGTGPSISTP